MKTKLNTIIAVTALAIAAFGATPLGHAATRFVLPKNSVGSGQLKKNAVTGAKIKNGTLTAAKFKKGQLPAGPAPQGVGGDPGVAQLGGWRAEQRRGGAGVEPDPDGDRAGLPPDRPGAGVGAGQGDHRPAGDQVHKPVGHDPAGAAGLNGQLPEAAHPGGQGRRNWLLTVGDDGLGRFDA